MNIRTRVARRLEAAVCAGAAAALLAVACNPADTAPTPALSEGQGGTLMSLTISSPAFQAGQSIPRKYTCQGNDVSPALQWSEPPVGVQSFALIMDDPDAPAGTWVHWVVYDIPAPTRRLDEGVPNQPELPDGSRQGKNSWGRVGYGGPCPPSGSHRYFFKLYALDRPLGLPAGATKQQVLQAMQGHILAQGELMGTYRKS